MMRPYIAISDENGLGRTGNCERFNAFSVIDKTKLNRNCYRKAFSLVEVIVSSVFLSIIFMILLSLLSFVLNQYKKSVVYSELFHSATVAMDFLETQLRGAKEVKLTAAKSGSMMNLEIKYLVSDGLYDRTETTVFIFDSTAKNNNVQFHRLNFGGAGNELALYITNIKMSLNDKKNMLSIEITTDTKLEAYKKSKLNGVSIKEPIVLSRNIYLKYSDNG